MKTCIQSMLATISAIAIVTLLASPAAFALNAGTLQLAQQRMAEAEQALTAGEPEKAYRLVESAARTPTELEGRGLAVISARALGDNVYGELFKLRSKIRTELGKRAEANGLIWQQPTAQDRSSGSWRSRNAVEWYLAASNAEELARLIRQAPEKYDFFLVLASASYDSQGQATFHLENVANYSEPLGQYSLVPEELAAQGRFRKTVLPLYKQRIGDIAREILRDEAKHFASPLTDMEKQWDPEKLKAIQEAVTGVEAEQSTPIEIQRKFLRADGSREMLKDSIEWLGLLRDPAELEPATSRSKSRGETFMAIGSDSSLLPIVQQDGFEEAGRYFYIAKDKQMRELAEKRYMAMDNEVQEYLAKRRVLEEASEEKFRADAEAIEEDLKKMEKTEAEKQSFDDEADALEAELDF